MAQWALVHPWRHSVMQQPLYARKASASIIIKNEKPWIKRWPYSRCRSQIWSVGIPVPSTLPSNPDTLDFPRHCGLGANPLCKGWITFSIVRLSKLWPKGPWPFDANEVSLEHSHAHSFIYYLWLLLLTMAEWSSHNRDHMGSKAKNIYYLVPCRKSLPMLIWIVWGKTASEREQPSWVWGAVLIVNYRCDNLSKRVGSQRQGFLIVLNTSTMSKGLITVFVVLKNYS